MKHVLITGVSTGIGYAAAQAFILKGYHVYGSVRTQPDADKLQRAFGPQFSPLLFDVTDHAAIAAAAKKVGEAIEREGLACLINNAGISTSAPLMLQPLDDIRHKFEVNVIGFPTPSRCSTKFGPSAWPDHQHQLCGRKAGDAIRRSLCR